MPVILPHNCLMSSFTMYNEGIRNSVIVDAKTSPHVIAKTIGATVKLEFEFVGEGRTMQLILVIMGQFVAHILSIIAGPFTTGPADATGRRTQVRPGAPKILLKYMTQFKEDRLQLLRKGPQKDDITGGAMHVHHPTTTVFPKITEGPQVVCGIKLTGRLIDPHRMKVGNGWKLLLQI